MNGSRNKGVKVEVVLLTITHSDPLQDFVFLVPAFWILQLLDFLGPKWGMLFPRAVTKVPLNYEL